jgi:hypothetical protein
MPSPLNYIYLLYTLVAAFLTYKNIRATQQRHNNDTTTFLYLGRLGTLILTSATFIDNLRTFLASFPFVLYPKGVASAANATAATNAWMELHYDGAAASVGMFWLCESSHVFLSSLSLFTIFQLYTVLSGRNTNDAAVRKVFLGATVVVAVLFVVSLVGFVVGPCEGPLMFEEPRTKVYTLTSVQKSPVLDGLLGVFVYSFGMIGLSIYAMCCHGLSRRNISFAVGTILSLALNGASGGATGVRSVLGNFGEQLLFGSVLYYDFSLNGSSAQEGDGDETTYLQV